LLEGVAVVSKYTFLCLSTKPFLVVIDVGCGDGLEVTCLWGDTRAKYVLSSGGESLLVEVPLFRFRLVGSKYVMHFLNELDKVFRMGLCREVETDLLKVLEGGSK